MFDHSLPHCPNITPLLVEHILLAVFLHPYVVVLNVLFLKVSASDSSAEKHKSLQNEISQLKSQLSKKDQEISELKHKLQLSEKKCKVHISVLT